MAADKPRLLSGGNPQIPKGEGDGPVQAYIAAMPFDIHETDEVDEKQLVSWIEQASSLPGEKL